MFKKYFIYILGLFLSITLLFAQTPTMSNVTKLYVATFKRAPDSAGLDYWLNRSGLSLEGIAKSFFDQPETKKMYPDGYSNHDFIEAVYQNLFNREPDTKGWKYWENELDSGNISRSTFILAVINGALEDDALLLSNKEMVGEYFAAVGLNDKDEAAKVISWVDTSSESVESVKEYIDSISGGSVTIPDDWSSEEANSLKYLNQIRRVSGMKPFKAESHLHAAAANHSEYLVINNVYGHYEEEGKSGYTGAWPWDRAVAAGYPLTMVSENYATSAGYKSNIDGLFTAIYHRIGFFDFNKDEIGIGVYSLDGKNSYTYDMGNSQLRAFCEKGESDFDGGTYYKPCANSDIKLSADKYRDYSNTEKSKDFVVYPVGNVKQGLFFSESPYPIPGYGFSGNPVSVSFNPYNIDCSSIVVDSFTLKDVTDDRILSYITLMDKDNDPNSHFTECDFALFPSEREEYGHSYKAFFTYDDNSGRHTIEWTFSIPVPGGDISHVLKAVNSENRFTIYRGKDYYIYIPPTQDYPSIVSYSYSYDNPEFELIDWYDSNTMHIRISAESKKGYIDMNINNIEVYLNVK